MTARQKVLSYLMEGKQLSRMECLAKFGTLNLPDIIWRLKLEGHIIDDTWQERDTPDGKKRWKEWSLVRLNREA